MGAEIALVPTRDDVVHSVCVQSRHLKRVVWNTCWKSQLLDYLRVDCVVGIAYAAACAVSGTGMVCDMPDSCTG